MITKDDITVVEGGGKQDDIKGRIGQIRQDREDRLRLRPREAPGAPGAPGGRRGGHQGRAATEVELKEKKHRIEDDVRSTKAAVEEGVVNGGGVAC